MNITSISVSRFQLFNECPAKYKYHYVMKLEPEEEFEYFLYGSIVHKISEELVKSKGKTPIGEIAENVISGKLPINVGKDGKPEYAKKLSLEYSKKLPGHLKSINKLCEQIGYDNDMDETEYRFTYDLDPPNNRPVLGLIDRVIKRGDKWFIIDYKTTKKGRWRKDRISILKDLQLRTYSRVIQKQFNVSAENIKAALYYVEGGDLIAVKYSDKSLINAEQELLKAYKQIESMPEEKAWGNVGDWCYRCDYRRMCTFLKIT